MMDSTLIEYLERDDELVAGREEAVDVFCWRMEQLVRAGYSYAIASALADRTEIDLHVACELRANGCAQNTAFLILS